MYAAREAAQQLPSLQEAISRWLGQYRKGRFEVHVDTSDLEPKLDALGRMTRTLTLGLVVVGVLIASAIAANAPETGTFRSLRDVAMIGYAARWRSRSSSSSCSPGRRCAVSIPPPVASGHAGAEPVQAALRGA